MSFFSSSSTPRGLSNFIADLRAAPNKELETKRVDMELAKIRQKFRENTEMDAYNRKKYMWKLIYMNLLGHEVDVGHIQAANMIGSQKYSEKWVGYLACTSLLNENSEFLTLIVNTIHQDILGNNPHHQSLALSCVANVGGKDMAEAISADVLKLCLNRNTRSQLRKKAALALLHLYRKNPDVIEPEMFVEAMPQLLEERNMGVLTSNMALVQAVTSREPKPYEASVIPRCVKIVEMLLSNKMTKEHETYLYYGIPSPWLLTKTLRLLRVYTPERDDKVRASVVQILQRIFKGTENQKEQQNRQRNNAAHAILFEAFALLFAWDADDKLVRHAVTQLGQFIDSREPNIRYLALESFSRVTQNAAAAKDLAAHREKFVKLLNDNDISIRRQALDVLYDMCTEKTAVEIVAELLDYLQKAELAIREELVLKIAILAEQFAVDFSWYVDVVLQLIALAGEHISEDIWYRVVQIVTNQEDLQQYAARTVFKGLQATAVHETMVKVGGYILGEFGHLIANEADFATEKQFELLHRNWGTASHTTRGLLMSTYTKFLNTAPQLKAQVMKIFKVYRSNIEPELQQRALEYGTMVLGPHDVMGAVWELMPAFPERESAVLRKMRDRFDQVNDPLVWNQEKLEQNRAEQEEREAAGTELPDVAGDVDVAAPPSSGGGSGGSGAAAGGGDVGSLLNLDDSEPQFDAGAGAGGGGANPLANQSNLDDLLGAVGGGVISDVAAAGQQPDVFGDMPGATGAAAELAGVLGAPPVAAAAAAAASPALLPTTASGGSGTAHEAQVRAWYTTLLTSSSGVLYEDALIQIGVKSEYHGAKGRMILYFGNKTSVLFRNFRTAVPPSPSVRTQLSATSQAISPNQQIQQLLSVDCAGPFLDPPTLQIAFQAGEGRSQTLSIKLPITVTKFIEPVEGYVPAQEFFRRWKAIPSGPQENQSVFNVAAVDVAKMSAVVTDMHLAVLPSIDPNPSNIVTAGIFYCEQGEVISLAHIESNAQAKMVRLTVRTAHPQLTQAVAAALSSPLKNA